MKTKQKFKRGNLVKIAKDLGDSMSHFENDKEAIIVGSYADTYGGNDTNSSYAVMFLDTGGQSSWYYERQLTLINEGGKRLFKQAKANRARISKQNTDINYILPLLDKGQLSSESILYLFKISGLKSSFYKNGEFYALYSEWSMLLPFFVHIKNAKTLRKAESVFGSEALKKFNVKKVYKIFRGVAH